MGGMPEPAVTFAESGESVWYFNERARQWVAPRDDGSAHAFHRRLPGYRPTPLLSLPWAAAELGVGSVLIKDESLRLGLPAFKVLGASWAVFRAVNDYLGRTEPDLDALRRVLPADSGLTLVTASDGNHGRAVAHMAAQLGIGARIHLPAGLTAEAVAAIRAEGAAVVEGRGVYDEVVAQAAASTAGVPTEILVQDTSWPGYEQIPAWIVQGYGTLFAEIDDQLGDRTPDLVAVPVGVGSLLHSAVDHYRGTSSARPRMLSVEPVTAACVATALITGHPVPVDTSRRTVMAGLNCGTVSELGWPAIRDGVDAAVGVTDAETDRALNDLNGIGGLSVGPCGAATLAGVRSGLGRPERREQLGLTRDSIVVLISTEGFAANPSFSNGDTP